MAGLTEQGFKRKTREEILDDMKASARNLFGSNINLAENSPIGLFIRLISYALALVWYTMEKVYNSKFVDTATGQSLDYTAKYVGVTRRDPVKATGTVIVKGTEGVDIPEGFIFETAVEPVIQFQTTEDATINSFGQVEIEIEAVEPGEDGNVASNTITEIASPSSGVSSVTNPDRTEGGLERETDQELRERYYESVAIGGAATIESIRAALLELPGVLGAEVEHNTTMHEVDGMPPKSLEAFVFGGEEEDIVDTIFATKAAGIEPHGDESATVTDSMGNEHTIKYTRPEEKTIYVEATLSTDANFPIDGKDKVQSEIIKYIGGVDEDETEYLGLPLGEDVIFTRIIAAIHNIDGITDVDLYIGLSESPTGQENITIESKEVAATSPEEIVVN